MLVALVVTGCKSSKTSVDEGVIIDKSTEQVLTDVAASYRSWNTYSTSGKLSISGAMSFSTSMQLKMVHDKSVVISIRPVLGIEVAKIYVDNDSAVVVDKIHKVYASVELDRFANILPMNIGAIQDILLSRAFTLNDGTLSTDNLKKFSITALPSGNGYAVSPRKKADGFAYEFVLNNDKQMETLNVYPSGASKTYSAMYSDFTTLGGAENIKVSATVKNKDVTLGLYMNSSKTKWDSDVDESLSISKSYRKVTVTEMLSILKSM